MKKLISNFVALPRVILYYIILHQNLYN